MKVVTANRLQDGEVVYLAPRGRFVDCLADAALAEDAAAEAALLAIARQAIAERLVVGAYSFEVVAGADGIVPTSTRERIRATGPSVRRDLGKQAAAAR